MPLSALPRAAWCSRSASPCPWLPVPVAVMARMPIRCAHRALRSNDAIDDDARYASETRAGAEALTSGEIAEGIASFVQKREARW